jgi:hypothetical protein
MDREILYQPPKGPLVVEADIRLIVHDILNRDETFWGHSHGAIFLSRNVSFAPTLVIVYKNGYGYHFQLTEAEGTSRETYICVGNDDFADVVTVWVGQNDMRFPRAFFIDRALAARVVENFCRTGCRDVEGNWIRKRDTDWDFYGPESEEDDE